MILKSDGAALYNTTDLATIRMRMEEYQPDKMIYLTDKRQDLYFEQVFRCAKKTKLVKPETELLHIGFGTMNGKDGKPYKTRQGGVPRLENLIAEINEEMLRKIKENSASKGYQVDEEEAARTSKIVGLAAIKYGDLSNQPAKDYVFDVDRFTSFEGDTGPYVLYTIVRIKSILAKYKDQGGCVDCAKLQTVQNDSEKALVMELTKFNTTMEAAYEECAPNKICAYIYDLANQFNRFYHETPIISEADEAKKAGWIALLSLTRDVLEACIEVLGFGAPERM
jgi:arginyl-tRNA synthetase